MILPYVPPLMMAPFGQSLTGGFTLDKVILRPVTGFASPDYDSTERAWLFPVAGYWRVRAMVTFEASAGAVARTQVMVGSDYALLMIALGAGDSRTDALDIMLRVENAVTRYSLQVNADVAGTDIAPGPTQSRVELNFIGPLPDMGTINPNYQPRLR